jgi:histidinol-phosphate aminotransferase
MLRVKAPYNINKLTTEVALRALEQKETLRTSVDLLNLEREKVARALADIPAVKKVHPSDSNFILAVVDNAYSVYKTMADAGVVIRYRGDQLHCESTVRITIGTPDENERMLAMLREVTS